MGNLERLPGGDTRGENKECRVMSWEDVPQPSKKIY